MALIPKPPFPNVPKLPGVPQLPRSPIFPPAPAPVLGAVIALGRLWQALFAQPQWGIYKSEKPQTPAVDGVETVTVIAERTPVVKPDSFLDFSYTNEQNVVDYPVQEGSFASYNKVANPFEIMLRLSKGGSKQERQEFIDSVEAIVGTVDFYDILTPEKTYFHVNVTRLDVSRRGREGAYFLSEVDLYFREIRTVTAAYTNTSTITENAQDPSATPVDNLGTVQPQSVPAEMTPDSLGIQPGEM